MTRTKSLNPLCWLLPLLLVWALLAAGPFSPKTASGQNLPWETASTESAPSKPAPPLAFADGANKNASGDTVVTKGGASLSTLGPEWKVIAPSGTGAATGPLPAGYTTVSRWVSAEEAAAWIQNGGTAIPNGVGAGNRVYVTTLGAAKPGGTGPIRIDFAIPEKALSTAGKPEWFQLFQPMQSTPVYNVQIHVPQGVVIPSPR